LGQSIVQVIYIKWEMCVEVFTIQEKEGQVCIIKM